MFTEQELRDMLRASADRVAAQRAVTRPGPPPAGRTALPPVLRTARSHRRRIVAPVAVAACTATIVAGGATLAQRSNHAHTDRPAASRQPAAHRAAAQPLHTRPATQAQPTFHGAITDVVRINTPHSTESLVQPENSLEGQQYISSQIGHDRTANLLIAPASAFDDSKITRTHPVRIAGRTGYYAVLRLYPLSADGHGGSAPAGVIVFRSPDRHWVFASLQAGTHNNTLQGTPVNDASAIIGGFNSLHATFEPGTYRTPLRLGYLPAGTSFVEAYQTSAHSVLTLASLTSEGSGDKEMDVNLLPPGSQGQEGGRGSVMCPGPQNGQGHRNPCTVIRNRQVAGGFELNVEGTDYSATEVQKVLEHVTVASDPGRNTHYYPLREAVR